MNIKRTLIIYKNTMKQSWIAWSALFFTGLEALATQSDHLRSIVGEKWYPYAMIAMFMVARFRPSKVLPPKNLR